MVTTEVQPESRISRVGLAPGPLRVAISGASGLVGSALATALTADGHRVLRLVRHASDDPSMIHWDYPTGRIDAAKLDGIDALVHLAGENVASGKWNPRLKARIRDSRVLGTRLIAETLATLDLPPRVLVQASAIGFYGHQGDDPIDESCSRGEGFLADTCEAWEAATQAAEFAGLRVPKLRIGVVLSPAGGALRKMLPIFRLGLGGRLGNGRQYMSWIALGDLVEIIRFALYEPTLDGPINAVAPFPVTNAEFTKTLARVLGRPALFPVPEFILVQMAGGLAREALLASARVLPTRLEEAGFRFQYPELRPALESLLLR